LKENKILSVAVYCEYYDQIQKSNKQTSTPSPAVIVMLGVPAGTGQSANISTSDPTSKIAGARINTPRHVGLPPSFSASIGTESSISKLLTCKRRVCNEMGVHIIIHLSKKLMKIYNSNYITNYSTILKVTWLPKKFLWTVQSSPPISSWPPDFCPTSNIIQ
jgi:hypothetical protein